MIKRNIIEVREEKDIFNHVCIKVKQFTVCYCQFKVKCPNCGKEYVYSSQTEALFQFNNRCHSCRRQKDRNYLRKKYGVKYYSSLTSNRMNGITPPKDISKKMYETGKLSENIVQHKLMDLGYIVSVPIYRNNKGFDLVAYNQATNKFAKIQVKGSDINHNNTIRRNRQTNRIKKDADFDILIVYLLNYNTFYVFKKENMKKFLWTYQNKTHYSVPINVTFIDDKKEKIYPFQDNWDELHSFLA